MPPLETTLAPAQPEDMLELDELWSSVRCKANACWLWVALCRRTRQRRPGSRVAAVRTAAASFGQASPDAYRPAQTYSDFWQIYQSVFGEDHQSVGKETAHIERWNNTLRQRLARFVRKSLAFSKNGEFQRIALKLFIHEYNLNRAS